MKPSQCIFAALLAIVLAPVSLAEDDTDAVVDRQHCPPDCGIGVTVPGQRDRAPSASPVTLVVKPGERIEFLSDQAVQVIFPEQTPFVDRQGRPVYTFNLRSRRAQQLSVRDEEDICTREPGCKYIVIDRSEAGRPPLDPWIIIDR